MKKVLHMIFRAEDQRLIIVVSSYFSIKMLRANKKALWALPRRFFVKFGIGL